MTSFTILDGLPVYGPLAKPFPTEWGRLGREGTVVEFRAASGERWTGNFARGLGGATAAIAHPDGKRILVLSQGDLWVVDPETQSAQDLACVLEAFWPVHEPDGFVFSRQGLAFLRLDTDGIRWHTRRISWDGFDALKLDHDRITGMAWNAVGDHWQAFSVSLETGQSTGGGYDIDDSEGWEQLAPRRMPPNDR